MTSSFKNLASDFWALADLLRGDFKQSQYGRIILPFALLRRLECVLEDSKDAVLAENEKAAAMNLPEEAAEQLIVRATNGLNFYNTSKMDLSKLGESGIQANLISYIQGFSKDTLEIFEYFNFAEFIVQLGDANLLHQVVQRIRQIDLNPERVSNHEMGLAFEELIRRFAEGSNETAGEHFTPRDIVRLTTALVFMEDDDALTKPGIIRTIYDPTAGTGGFLSSGMEYVHELNPNAVMRAFGQELNPESYAICKADMLIKGQEVDNIKLGNTLSNDQLHDMKFDYMLSNPPFGLDWNNIGKDIQKEQQEKGFDGRFGPGLPRMSDGSLLFLMHMISKLRDASAGGGRIGIILNGSPLITGGAGSGESKIREYLLENDLLEAVVSLPRNMFNHTGIQSYVLILTNRKSKHRIGKIQVIDARSLSVTARVQGGERNSYDQGALNKISEIHKSKKATEISRYVINSDFYFWDIHIGQKQDGNFQRDYSACIKALDESKVNDIAKKQFVNHMSWSDSSFFKIDRRYCKFNLDEIWASTKLKRMAGGNCPAPIPASKCILSIEVNLEKKPAGEDCVFVTKAGRIVATRQPNEIGKSGAYCIRVNPDVLHPDYFVEWINNSRIGKATIRFVSDGSMPRFNPTRLMSGSLWIPGLETQKTVIECSSKIDEHRQSLNELYESVWNEIVPKKDDLEKIEEIRFGMSHENWFESLPFPLSSILWRHSAIQRDPMRRFEALLHFFEALAAFIANIHLSALYSRSDIWSSAKSELNRKLNASNLSLERATFGTWKLIAEFGASQCRELLDDDAENIYGTGDEQILEMLCDPSLLGILQRANQIRNSQKAHSGAQSDEETQRFHDELEKLLQDVRGCFGLKWKKYELVQPLKSAFSRGEFTFDVMQLHGSRTPFKQVKRNTFEPMEQNELYMLDRGYGKWLRLFPFIRVMPSPERKADACYIFNRMDSAGCRMVSYHLEQESSFTEKSDEIGDLLEALRVDDIRL